MMSFLVSSNRVRYSRGLSNAHARLEHVLVLDVVVSPTHDTCPTAPSGMHIPTLAHRQWSYLTPTCVLMQLSLLPTVCWWMSVSVCVCDAILWHNLIDDCCHNRPVGIWVIGLVNNGLSANVHTTPNAPYPIPNCEVKRSWGDLVLWWVTTWETSTDVCNNSFFAACPSFCRLICLFGCAAPASPSFFCE